MGQYLLHYCSELIKHKDGLFPIELKDSVIVRRLTHNSDLNEYTEKYCMKLWLEQLNYRLRQAPILIWFYRLTHFLNVGKMRPVMQMCTPKSLGIK